MLMLHLWLQGVQIGTEYPIEKGINIGLNAKYLIHDYETDLIPSTSVKTVINHKSTAFIAFGINYTF